MLTAISRYGVRIPQNLGKIVAHCRKRGELARGPFIAHFEDALSAYLGSGRAVSASFGRMAFFYILKAFQLPAGAEIIVPALTFWVIPEMARVAGLKVVFADVDPATFNLDPQCLEKAITDRTRAIVPTHLYGLPCDMEAILRVAERHNLYVIEDCAHALGARYRGRPVGTFGHAAFFSFQALKPLNTFGGGMALVQDPQLGQRVADLAHSEPWLEESLLLRRLRFGQLQRFFMKPAVFTMTGFPILWFSALLQARPDVYLWEAIRSLNPLPAAYTRRYTNVQAAIGLAGLRELEKWNEETRCRARRMDEALGGLPWVVTPRVPPDVLHIYYQYCVYVPNRDDLVRRAILRGVDVETLHVDVCTRVGLFRDSWTSAPCAERAAQAVQLPVYCSLKENDLRRIAAVIRRALLNQTKKPLVASQSVQ